MAIDPVCGMTVNQTTPDLLAEHEGRTYAFCSARCRQRFTADPGHYVGRDETISRAASHRSADSRVAAGEPTIGTEYTCPMHPEVVQDHPGSCPKCGMALEPRTIAVDEEENEELADMRRRFWVSAVLSVPLLVLAMGEEIPGVDASGLASPR
ncbi:MAG TPA: heavy metal-binding domain-containing protein, partial [Candidatus Sulfomarinibacteraceae bacterium]|nr:heavy metal-binding domain-containing protein [Candidatus Sulfomarinibacteraceae bacterium]